jgi:hypothetical protein
LELILSKPSLSFGKITFCLGFMLSFPRSFPQACLGSSSIAAIFCILKPIPGNLQYSAPI